MILLIPTCRCDLLLYFLQYAFLLLGKQNLLYLLERLDGGRTDSGSGHCLLHHLLLQCLQLTLYLLFLLSQSCTLKILKCLQSCGKNNLTLVCRDHILNRETWITDLTSSAKNAIVIQPTEFFYINHGDQRVLFNSKSS